MAFLRCEIDESKIISHNNTIIWMFGMVERYNKSARVFYVMSDGTKNKLLPIIKNNLHICGIISDDLDLRARIYSNGFSSYQENDFANLGYVLRKLNHSV